MDDTVLAALVEQVLAGVESVSTSERAVACEQEGADRSESAPVESRARHGVLYQLTIYSPRIAQHRMDTGIAERSSAASAGGRTHEIEPNLSTCRWIPPRELGVPPGADYWADLR